MKKILWLLPMLLLVCSGMLNAAPASAQETRVKIRLTGAAIAGVRPQGSSEYRADARQQSFRVEVNLVNLPDSTPLTASVNGKPVGTIVLVAGAGKVELQSERRQIVPAIKPGDVVRVSTSSGVLILSGKF